jgi:hypothetical protein
MFNTLLGGAAVWPVGAHTQQLVHLIGILASQFLPPLQRFECKLQEYGYIEGQNVRFVRNFAEGRDDRYSAMAAELVALHGSAGTQRMADECNLANLPIRKAWMAASTTEFASSGA